RHFGSQLLNSSRIGYNMRRVYDPVSGSDVTSTVQAFLQSGGAPVTAFLYSFQCMNFWDYNPYGSYASFCYTDFETPLFLNYAQIGPGVSTPLGTWHNGSFYATG